MSKTGSNLGKSLKGISSSGAALSSAIEDSIINQISSGSIEMTNIQITGGTINSTVIGNDVQGPIFATTLQTGFPDGTGFDVIFYGDTLGEYFKWDSAMGLTEISGDLTVTQTTNLGNIRISGNTISTSNVNGDIILNPNGSGGININGDIVQTTNSGNVSFETTDGYFSATAIDDVNLTSTAGEINLISQQQQNITSNDGDVIISSGANKTSYSITRIFTGSQPVIRTALANNLEVGDSLFISGTDSVPNIDGDYTVASIIDSTDFTIIPGFIVNTAGNTGTFQKNSDIYLSASNNINIPYDVKLVYGIDSNYIRVTSVPLDDMDIVSLGDINLSAGADINIPQNIGLTFGSDSRKIEANATDLSITSNVNLNITTGNSAVITASSIDLATTTVTTNDRILTLANNTTSDDNKDRGIEFKYHDGISTKLGYFGYDDTDGYFAYFMNATNNNEVISGTLGNAKFNLISFASANISTGITVPQIDVCNINCSGTMTITAGSGINLTTAGNITIPQGTPLRFGDSQTAIYKEASPGSDLVIQSAGHVFLTPGSNAFDVIMPNGSGLVFNGEGGSQKIESLNSTELTVSSASFLNLSPSAGGVRVTQNLPIIFNTAENSKITGDNLGNLIVGSGNSINLVPISGQVTLPINKNIEFGSPTEFIGSNSSGNVLLNSDTTITSTSRLDTTIRTTSGDIFLTPVGTLKNVVMPGNKSIIFGNVSQYIGTNSGGDVLINSGNGGTFSSTGTLNLTSTGSAVLINPSSYVEIPYNKPLRFGSSAENITGSSGNLAINAGTSTLNGNLTVNGGSTLINSDDVKIADPILTLSTNTTVSDDNKDRGIEFKYNDGISQKLGYFGYDDSDGYFMYVPVATNNSEIISGALGNAKFATGSFTGLNLNNGNISSVNTVASNTNLNLDPGPGYDIILNVDSGSNVIIPVNVDLLFDGEDAKFFSDGTDLHVDVTAPGKFLIDTNTVVNGDFTVNGNVNISGGSTVNFTVERSTVPAFGSFNPNGTSNVCFISVSGTGVATGTMSAGAIDGFIKTVCMTNIPSGCSYELTFPTGRLIDPVSGSSAAKKLIFETSGQSVQMVWDGVASVYLITQGGAEVVAI